MNRRDVLRNAIVVALLGAATTAMADTYPSKPVTIVIPFPPGGTLDVVGRMLAQKLTEQMGQSFIVDNRPGAGGTIGASVVKNARADGYTLLPNASRATAMAARVKCLRFMAWPRRAMIRR